ncbi:MAG TPA: hypothetical protein VJ750_02395 [Rhizomicrobium sp.]|nr:hypothetical protein [Rhizomicrobium sp.]
MLERIQQWYREAAALHGDDWPSIQQYVIQKMTEISRLDRIRLLEEFNAMQPCGVGPLHS